MAREEHAEGDVDLAERLGVGGQGIGQQDVAEFAVVCAREAAEADAPECAIQARAAGEGDVCGFQAVEEAGGKGEGEEEEDEVGVGDVGVRLDGGGVAGGEEPEEQEAGEEGEGEEEGEAVGAAVVVGAGAAGVWVVADQVEDILFYLESVLLSGRWSVV